MAAGRFTVTTLRRAGGPRRASAPAGCTVGQVVAHGAHGELLVEWPGNDRGPVAAGVVVGTSAAPGSRVLLVFDDGDAGRPVVVGAVGDAPAPASPSASTAALHTAQDVVVELPTLVVEARRQIVLRCGAGSVTIRADGTIVIKGTNLLSRSSGGNRIKGASVQIN